VSFLNRWPQKPPIGTIIDRSADLAQGLVAQYVMNEGGGNYLYDALKTSNSNAFTGTPKWGAGYLRGPALSGFSSSAYVQAPIKLAANPSISNATYIAWINASSVAAYHSVMITRANSTYQGLALSNTSGNALTCNWQNSSSEYGATTGLTLSLNKWYFAAGVITPTSTIVYLGDPVAGTLRSYTITITRTAHPLGGLYYIGYDSQSSAYSWNGIIDNVSFYNRSLSSSEIQLAFTNPFSHFMPQRGILFSKAKSLFNAMLLAGD
jgi:hypothetical protein